jgi:hypothetical protein
MIGLSNYLTIKTITSKNQREAHRASQSEQDKAQNLPEVELSPEELRRQEANRRAYERMARGSTLAEVEYSAQKLQQGRR